MPSRSKPLRTRKPSADTFDALALYRILAAFYGPSGWWPGESPLEVAVGAVLTQNTAWVNVEKAISKLKERGMLDLQKLHAADHPALASLIRASGYYNIKARRLKHLVAAAVEAGGLDAFLSRDKGRLREDLLAVNGIGRETADSIGCYAAGKTIFVIDAYTRRILTRHGFPCEDAGYDEIRLSFEENLPDDLTVYQDLHAYLVFVGKEFCRPKNPRCQGCPLDGWNARNRSAE